MNTDKITRLRWDANGMVADSHGPFCHARIAERIIDKLTAALEAANADRAAIINEKVQALKAAESRAEALQARVAELEAERDDWKKTAQAGCYTCPQEHASRLAAEAELAQMRERVARALEWTDDSEKLTCEALAYHVAEALRGR